MTSQVGLVSLSLAAVYCGTSKDHKTLRWVQVLGLLAQPFWFYESYTHQQWGIFAMSFVFTAIYAKGFYTYWVK